MRYRILALTAAILASTAGGALAQDGRDARGTAVDRRSNPDFSPLGVRAGAFLIRPSVTVAGQYDDNVFADERNTIDDYVLVVQPRLTAGTNWGRHALNFRTGGEFARFQDFGSEDYDDYYIGGDGRLDIGVDYAATAGANYARKHEERGSPNDVRGREPVEFDQTNLSLGLSKGVTRITGRVRFDYAGYDFDDVRGIGNAEIDQDNRDRDTYGTAARVGYEFQPGLATFVEGGYNWVRYDRDSLRDNEGYRLTAGAAIDLGGITSGEIFAGYRSQQYDNPAFSNNNGFAFGGNLLWRPTGLTSVRLSLVNEVAETIEAGSSGFTANSIGVEVDHELLRNVLLSADVRYTSNDYKSSVREDDVWSYGAGARYLVNRNFSVGADWRRTDRASNLLGADFDRNVFTVRVSGAI
ncbi:MAG TPA: outer membrane beta-barrel protein [Azospirillaceae bacterium]|nr:outer membrane beta-barrel protein [Azospirillaceae bacterium]